VNRASGGHRETDGQACEGNRRDDRERTSQYAATYQKTYVPAFNFCEYRARAYNPVLGRFMSEDPRLFDAGDYNLSVIATMIRST
jgi:RHS repeat-associated protein